MQWLLIVPLAIIGIWVVGLNYLCAYLAVVKHEHHSLLPFILDLGCAFTLFSFFYAVIVLKVFHKP